MKLIKILFTVFIVLSVVALVIGGIFIFGRKTAKTETNEYYIEEDYSNILIDTSVADITVLPSDDGATKVVTCESEKMTHTVRVENGALKIELNDKRSFIDRLATIFYDIKITLYLPEGEHGEIAIESDTGRVEIADRLTFSSIYISESTGDVSCFAYAIDGIRIKTSTGKIIIGDSISGSLDLTLSTGDVELRGVTCTGDVQISLSTGKTTVTALECRNFISSGSTGEVQLNSVFASEKIDIERSTGSVLFSGIDASEIMIETDTGDVKGTILTEKVFYAQSDTGRVDVPRTASGGICEVTTDTGNIIISIEG